MRPYDIISYRLYPSMLPELPAMAPIPPQQRAQRFMRFHYYHAFIEATGYSHEELISAPHCIICHPDIPRHFFVDLWKTILNGRDWHGHLKNLHKDGSYYWSCTKISPQFSKNQISGFIAVSTKIPGSPDATSQCLCPPFNPMGAGHAYGDAVSRDSVQ